MNRVMRLAAENAVVIFSSSSCYMCHTIKTLFSGFGVNAVIYELDLEPNGKEMERALSSLLGRNNQPVPAVFIGGKLIGSTDRVMSLHLGGNLIPLLRDAGAIWL